MTTVERQEVEIFADVVREHQAGLRAYVRSLGVDEIWVDDIAQEVFLVAFRRQADFRAGADYGKWLRGIAKRLAANERRKEARRSRLMHGELTDMLMQQPLEAEPPELDLVVLTCAMEECIPQLAPHGRELLHRRYSQGENASSIGRQLRMSAEAIRQNLRRVRLVVKACVERKLQGVWP